MKLFPSNRPAVIIIGAPLDDEAHLNRLLGEFCDIRILEDVQNVINVVLEGHAPKLLLIDGHLDFSVLAFLCEKLHGDYRTLAMPILFYGLDMDEPLARHYEVGASGHIYKNSPAQLVACMVKAHLVHYTQLDLVRLIGNQLEDTIVRRTNEVIAAQDVTILALASLAEARDSETGNHIRRTQHYIRVLCEHLRGKRKFSHVLSDAVIDRIFKSAPLHDIGKVGIPDAILLKPGRLTAEEFEVMKTHTTLGKQAIERSEAQLGVSLNFLETAKEIAYSHQEKWDGSGYPQGLSGEQIPLSARLMAVADVYDALISKRIYKDAMSHSEAVELILQGSGSHFDPELVDAFMVVNGQFQVIAQRFSDFEVEYDVP